MSLKRYRYTGKERDQETGFNYHGARYYAPWLLRWMAVDPLESQFSPLQSPYNYCFNNPVQLIDDDGMGPGVKQNQTAGQPLLLNAQQLRSNIRQSQDGLLAPENHPTRQAIHGRQSHEQYLVDHADEIAYQNQQVLDADMYGNGVMGKRRDVRTRIDHVRQEHINRVAANVAGGPFGALGYLMGGDKGSEIGAGVDQATAAGAVLGNNIQARRYASNSNSGSQDSGPKPPKNNSLDLNNIELRGNRGLGPAIPRGFSTPAQFKQAGLELVEALKQSGIRYSEVGVRGSAVTNISGKGGSFRETAGGGKPASDIDAFVHLSENIGLNPSKNIPGFIHPSKLMKKYPLLQEWSNKWSRTLGREITPGAFSPGTFTDKKIIKF